MRRSSGASARPRRPGRPGRRPRTARRCRPRCDAAHNRREGVRPRQPPRRRDPGRLHLGRPDRLPRRGRPHDRRDGHGRASRRGRRPHPRRRGGAQLRPGDDPGDPAARAAVPPHARAADGARRADAHHVRDRLPLRRDGLHDGHRGGGAGPEREAHARGAARHAHPRQGLPAPDGQQRDRHGSPGGRGDRARRSRRGLADLGREDLRCEGRQPRGGGGLEVGQERQEPLRAGGGLPAR